MTRKVPQEDAVHAAVTAAYTVVAKGGTTCCPVELAPSTDYTPEEIASVPEGAYLGEGSGNPVHHAALKSGDTVVDLGSGAGIDSFLAANRVGPGGQVLGFDLTPAMLERARANATKGNYRQVNFQQAKIEHLPLADSTADVAISNCVINLSPDKRVVFAEIFRVLRPGGRISISDIVLRGAAEDVRAAREHPDIAKWCACVLGALHQDDYLKVIRDAGFEDVKIVAERPALSQPGGSVDAVAITLTAHKR